MTHILGRIDLQGAQLEQLPDGFIIHENGSGKVRDGERRNKSKLLGCGCTLTEWFMTLDLSTSLFWVYVEIQASRPRQGDHGRVVLRRLRGDHRVLAAPDPRE